MKEIKEQVLRYFENFLQRFTSKRGNSEKLFFIKYICNGSVLCERKAAHTPNVQGSEKVVITQNNRKLLKVKCASCGITKTRFMPGN